MKKEKYMLFYTSGGIQIWTYKLTPKKIYETYGVKYVLEDMMYNSDHKSSNYIGNLPYKGRAILEGLYSGLSYSFFDKEHVAKIIREKLFTSKLTIKQRIDVCNDEIVGYTDEIKLLQNRLGDLTKEQDSIDNIIQSLED